MTAALAALSRDPFARAHGRAALHFHLSLAAYFAATVGVMHTAKGTLMAVHLAPFLLFVNLMLVLNWVMFAVVGIRRAATGQTFTYPMTLRRLRRRTPATLRSFC